MRKQRNVADYSGDIIPESTMRECISQAEKLLTQFKDYGRCREIQLFIPSNIHQYMN